MNNPLGANWKTTVSGIGTAIFSALTVLAALPYTLGDISTLIPAEWKPRVVAAGLIGTAGLRIWNSVVQKSHDVRGGTVDQDARGNVATPQESTPLPPEPATHQP